MARNARVSRRLGSPRTRGSRAHPLSFDQASIAKSLALPDGRLDPANPAFCDLLGYRREELEALDIATITHRDDQTATDECMRRLLAGERAAYRLEKRYVRKDAESVQAGVNTMVLRDEAGQPLRCVTDALDIVERKRAQDALCQLSRRYEAVPSAAPGLVFSLPSTACDDQGGKNLEENRAPMGACLGG